MSLFQKLKAAIGNIGCAKIKNIEVAAPRRKAVATDLFGAKILADLVDEKLLQEAEVLYSNNSEVSIALMHLKAFRKAAQNLHECEEDLKETKRLAEVAKFLAQRQDKFVKAYLEAAEGIVNAEAKIAEYRALGARLSKGLDALMGMTPHQIVAQKRAFEARKAASLVVDTLP